MDRRCPQCSTGVWPLLLRPGTQAGRPTGAKANGRETCLGLKRARACQSTRSPARDWQRVPSLWPNPPRSWAEGDLCDKFSATTGRRERHGPLPNRRTLVQRSTGICLLWSGLGSSTNNHHTHRTLTGKQMCTHSEGTPASSVGCGRPPLQPAVSARVQGQREFQHSSIIKRAGGNPSGLASRNPRASHAPERKGRPSQKHLHQDPHIQRPRPLPVDRYRSKPL